MHLARVKNADFYECSDLFVYCLLYSGFSRCKKKSGYLVFLIVFKTGWTAFRAETVKINGYNSS